MGRPNDEMLVAESVKLAKKLGLPVVATQPIQFENPEDFEFHEARVAIADGFTLANKARPRIYTPQQYFRTKEEMCELFKDIPSAIENSVEIAKRLQCHDQTRETAAADFPDARRYVSQRLHGTARARGSRPPPESLISG